MKLKITKVNHDFEKEAFFITIAWKLDLEFFFRIYFRQNIAFMDLLFKCAKILWFEIPAELFHQLVEMELEEIMSLITAKGNRAYINLPTSFSRLFSTVSWAGHAGLNFRGAPKVSAITISVFRSIF